MRYVTDEDRWSAVRSRDPRAEDAFCYAVTTTGIYCRPGCPARLPKRENVTFHADAAAAEKAGYRACKRCHPDGTPQTRQRSALISQACQLIDAAQEQPDLDDIAARVGLSRAHFHRIFKDVTGLTPGAYAAAGRAQRMRDALQQCRTITDAVYQAGFQSSGRFYESSAGLLGMAPGHFRAGGRGETIRFALGDCSLGTILVAATQKGICAISLGDDPERLLHELQDGFPNAQLVGGDPAFEESIAGVISLVELPSAGLHLPLDIRGTVFQQRVWQALQAIPAGTTESYSEIARRIGQPHAARAVAHACASNLLAVAIPCHRVVRRDGSLGGYRWGLARKRALLEREAETH